MDPMTILAIAKFTADALREGMPVAQKVIDLVRSSDDAAAKALLPDLEAAYAASRDRAAEAHNRLQARS